jgi:hypothetical protein
MARSEPGWKVPIRGHHIFVVLRRDDYIADPIEAVTATKAYLSLREANAEVDRLNRLNADKNCLYFVLVARLQPPRTETLPGS